MILPYCVYILFSYKDLQLYTGMSSRLEKRLQEHNKGENKSTSGRRPLELIYCEFFLLKEDALKRESYFKTTQGKRTLKIMLASTLKHLGYAASQVGFES